MNKVGHLSDFPKDKTRIYYIRQFFGKSYDEAVASANLAGTFACYYEQIHGSKNQKSILVCWDGGKKDED